MLNALSSLMMPAAVDRLVLLLNHVIAAEPAAAARLMPHAGRLLGVHWRGSASPLPLPPRVALRITPAGLFERDALAPDLALAEDLRVFVDLPPPHRAVMQWLAGGRPQMAIEGDAQLAADVAWLTEHLRWDIEADLARGIGDAPAHELARLLRALGQGFSGAARRVSDTWSRRSAEKSPASG